MIVPQLVAEHPGLVLDGGLVLSGGRVARLGTAVSRALDVPDGGRALAATPDLRRTGERPVLARSAARGGPRSVHIGRR
ncbi:hypothetical protein AB0J72_49210 [Dactylosporangium sp. NPDC049742]|uniref:hypothetical protein n=1 Tax=Dactylosporangium sp. NPDC049742 TaxID=3154737 RepID=UPI003429EAE0